MKNTVETKQTFKLIDGTFIPSDAKEILIGMINHKINFHSTRSFSSVVRTGNPDIDSDLRIIVLGETRNELISLLNSATSKDKKVTIRSNIEVHIEEY